MSHPTSELSALLDGALPPERASAVRRHLVACAACATEERRLREALAVLGELPRAPEPSAFFAARLEQRLREERAGRAGWLQRLAARWRIAVPAAALCAVAVVAAGTVVRGRGRERVMAEHLALLEDYEAVASLGDVETADDVQVVAHLEELEHGGRP